jgi:hypothetical protein
MRPDGLVAAGDRRALRRIGTAAVTTIHRKLREGRRDIAERLGALLARLEKIQRGKIT